MSLLTICLAVVTLHARATTPAHDREAPRLLILDPRALSQARKRAQEGDSRMAAERDRLCKEADRRMRIVDRDGTYTVTSKTTLPPGAGKHDYVSYARYTDKTDVPDRAAIDAVPDIRNMGRMIDGVRYLSVGYYFTGRMDYAECAARLLRTWFLDDETRMTPHARFAQLEREPKKGGGGALIDLANLPTVLDGVAILAGTPAWTAEDDRGIRRWFGDYLQWLLEGDPGKKDLNTPNNHATWYATQVVTIALFLDRKALANEILVEFRDRRMGSQIAADGRQPAELSRGRTWDYSVYNLEGWFRLAALGDRAGVDLWKAHPPCGGDLRAALDYLVPFVGPNAPAWPRPQATPAKYAALAPLLYVAAWKYSHPAYLTLARSLDAHVTSPDLTGLLIPEPQ